MYTKKEIDFNVELLDTNKLSLKLIKSLLNKFPEGFFIEAYGAQHINEGILIERTIPILH